MQIVSGKQKKPQRIVIYGPEGIGKSSLAAQFPNPLFADIEGGTSTMDVARIPKPSSFLMLTGQIAEIKRDQMGFGTLVIDTADWTERLIQRHVCDAASVASIEDFGYGKGMVKAGEEFGKFLDSLTDLVDVGLNIVVLAHAHLKKFEQPDESGAYDRWELKLSKHCSPLLKEWADMVLFANYETIVVEDEKTKSKKGQGGRRVIHTQHHVCWDAKNRHDLPAKLDFPKDNAFAQIAHCIPSNAKPEQLDEFKDENNKPDPADAVHSNMPEDDVNPVETGTKIPKTCPTGFPAALWDLMDADGVSEEEVQKACAKRGYFPIDTPIANYGDEFVNGMLIANWPQVKLIIEEIKKEA